MSLLSRAPNEIRVGPETKFDASEMSSERFIAPEMLRSGVSVVVPIRRC